MNCGWSTDTIIHEYAHKLRDYILICFLSFSFFPLYQMLVEICWIISYYVVFFVVKITLTETFVNACVRTSHSRETVYMYTQIKRAKMYYNGTLYIATLFTLANERVTWLFVQKGPFTNYTRPTETTRTKVEMGKKGDTSCILYFIHDKNDGRYYLLRVERTTREIHNSSTATVDGVLEERREKERRYMYKVCVCVCVCVREEEKRRKGEREWLREKKVLLKTKWSD